jgi:transcriptional regulator with AAA-type ATPase domain
MLGERARGEHVSGVHLLVQRKSNRLWIRDQGSTNGTLVNDAEVSEAEIVAGRTFRVGDVTLLAMDQHMRRLRPHLLWTLGLSAHDHVDRALGVVVSGDALLLVGERGCDQRALAEEIHRTSSRRDRAFVPVQGPLKGRPEQVAQLAHSSHGTAYLDLDDFGEMPAFFAGHLFGDEYHIRPILAAPDFATAARRLGEHFAPRLRVITVPTIRDRRGDVPRLLDILFRRIIKERLRAAGTGAEETAEARRQVAELGPETVARLVAFDWPDNFPDLERNAARLLALIENQGNLRAAARSLGVSHKALGDALKRIGVRG